MNFCPMRQWKLRCASLFREKTPFENAVMACCTTKKHSVHLPPRVQKYSCKTTKVKPCSYIRFEALLDLLESRGEVQIKKENETVKKLLCENAKPPLKKKFKAMGQKQICAIPHSRRWNLENNSCSRSENGLPNWFRRQLKKFLSWRSVCPRELDDYEKNLWAPICKPKIKGKECQTPIDEGVCVFCLGSLYTGGYLHELVEKIPSIQKQSEIYGDEIMWRISIRTRVIVHKKCYESYIDISAHKAEKEVEVGLGNDDIDDDDLNCGEEEEEEEEKKERAEKQEKEDVKEKRSKKKSKDPKLPENLRKQYFCLKKFELPKIESGKFFS